MVLIFILLCIFIVGLFRPYYGLLILAALGPFFTILHELTPGYPVLFLWPFILVGLITLSIIISECKALAQSPDCNRRFPYIILILVTLGMLVFVANANELLGLLAAKKINGIEIYLGNKILLVLSCVMALSLFCFLAVYFRAMEMREGRKQVLDVCIAILLSYGISHIFYTSFLSGSVFIGLEGFRYHYFMLIVYFLGRYYIQSEKQTKQLYWALGIAFVVGMVQILSESYMLNVQGYSPSEMPWVGFMSKTFGYWPDSERSFFSGDYRPNGIMFNTHFSGLFVVCGLAVHCSRFWLYHNWKWILINFVVVMLFIAASIWTSRTVLVVLCMSFLFSAVFMRAAWHEIILASACFIGCSLLVCYYLLPGFSYDVISDVRYVAERGGQVIVRGVYHDVTRIIGVDIPKVKDEWDELPGSWAYLPCDPELLRKKGKTYISAKRSAKKDSAGRETYVLRLGKCPIGKARIVLENTKHLRGQLVMVGAWVKSFGPKMIRFEINDFSEKPKYSDFYTGSHEWKFITHWFTVEQLSESVKLDVVLTSDEPLHKPVELGGFYLVSGGEVISLMGTPQGFPYLEQHDAIEKTKTVTLQQERADIKLESTRTNVDKLLKREKSFTGILDWVFGRGASYNGWSAFLFPEIRKKASAFAASSYGDMKYLEFFEQFGILGLFLLLATAVFSIQNGLRQVLRTENMHLRAIYLGMALIIVIGYFSMLHLPSLFKTGLNGTIFIAMAIVTRPLRREVIA